MSTSWSHADNIVVKPAYFVGTSLTDIRDMPVDVQDVVGKSLFMAQSGGKAANVKPLKGYAGAAVLEIVDEYRGRAYRVVYTTRMARAIYVLHAFEKKSTRGIKTPQKHIDTVNARLKIAEADDEQHNRQENANSESSAKETETDGHRDNKRVNRKRK